MIGSGRLDKDHALETGVSLSLSSQCHSYQEDGDPSEADVVEGDGPVVRVEPLGLARVEVLIPVDAVRL